MYQKKYMYVNVKRRFIIKYLNKLFKENNFSVGFSVVVYTLTSLASSSGPGGYAHSLGVESGVKICRVKYAELPAVAMP